MIKHLPARRGGERYLIITDQSRDDVAPWRASQISYHSHVDGPKYIERAEHSLSWSILQKRYNFGFGFGMERRSSGSLQFHLHLSRLGNLYFKFSTHRTRKWFSISQDKPLWFYDRKYAISLFNPGLAWVYIQLGCPSGASGRDCPGIDWNSGVLHRKFFGYEQSEWETLVEPMPIDIKLPEGDYKATVQCRRIHKWYDSWTGKLLTKFKPLPTWESWEIDIPNGIPVEGKGENSWDCGMDGTFSISFGHDVTNGVQAADELAKSILKDRERYGGPFDLPRAMSVKEASEWQMTR